MNPIDSDVPHADALVLFGATGDLAHKRIFPALYAMARRGGLKVPLVGVASSKWNLAKLRERAEDAIRQEGPVDNPAALRHLLSLLGYVGGDYNDPAIFAALKQALGDARHPAYYLAIPLALFATVIEGLGAAGLAEQARVVVEKPFAMEPPAYKGFDAVHDETADVFRAMRPLQPHDVVRGQYDGYRQETGVAADSDVETFCAVRLFIDSWRWGGVPWYVRSGKCLAEPAAEVTVLLKPPPQQLFADAPAAIEMPNYLRFRLSPHSAIALAARVKAAGKAFVGGQRELSLVEERTAEEMPYERLLGDAMAGNGALFTREDAVEAAWAVVDPVLTMHSPAIQYKRGGWGPAAADDLIAADGRWHNPRRVAATYAS